MPPRSKGRKKLKRKAKLARNYRHYAAGTEEVPETKKVKSKHDRVNEENDEVTEITEEIFEFESEPLVNGLEAVQGIACIAELGTLTVKEEPLDMKEITNDFKEDTPDLSGENSEFKEETPDFTGENIEIKEETGKIMDENVEWKIETLEFTDENMEMKVETSEITGENVEWKEEKPEDTGANIKIKEETPDFKEESNEVKSVPMIESTFEIKPEEFKNDDDDDSLLGDGPLTIDDTWLGSFGLHSPESLSVDEADIPIVLGSVKFKQIKQEEEEDDEDEEDFGQPVLGSDSRKRSKKNPPALKFIADPDSLSWPALAPPLPSLGSKKKKKKGTKRPITSTATLTKPVSPTLSIAGIALPKNIVPCLSPDPTDTNDKDTDQFFGSAFGSLYNQTGSMYKSFEQTDTNIGVFYQINDSQGATNTNKRQKTGETNVIQSPSGPHEELSFIQEYQQNARRRGKLRQCLESQISELKSKLGQYQGDSSENTLNSDVSKISRAASVVKIPCPSNLLGDNTSNGDTGRPTTAVNSTSVSGTKTIVITPASMSERSTARPGRKGKYQALIQRLKSGQTMDTERRELVNLLRIQHHSKYSPLDILEDEIAKAQGRLSSTKPKGGAADSGISSSEGSESGFNLNQQIPIVIAPTTASKNPTIITGKVLKRVIPGKDFHAEKAKVVSVVGTSSESAFLNSLKSKSKALKEIRESVKFRVGMGNNTSKRKRSRYENLTNELRSKQMENLEIFDQLQMSSKTTTPDVVSKIRKSFEESGRNSSVTMGGSSSLDLDDYEYEDDEDDEPRFKDDNYLTNFISSFQNNPRRYKVYPNATKFKKTGRNQTPPEHRVNRLRKVDRIDITDSE